VVLDIVDEALYCMFLSLLYRVLEHLVLLSFPTRRSSDLVVPIRHVMPSARHWLLASNNAALLQRARVGIAVMISGAAAAKMSNSDRKSTRLNSSHVEISYAVFCLKKKKNNG